MAGIALHRADGRFRSRSSGVQTRHSFSFGPHYDPANTGFGPLVLHDEHRLEPGAGFASHPHAGVEVVSWVLAGELVHEDPAGGVRRLGPGSLQHLSTGTGTVHAERAGDVPTRFVQAWLRSAEPLAAPSYDLTVPAPDGIEPVLAVGGAVLHAGRLEPGATSSIGAGGLLHVFVATGAVDCPAGRLEQGDAARSTRRRPLELRTDHGCRLLVWELPVADAQE